MSTIIQDDLWFLRCKVQRTEFFVILGHFCPLTLLTYQKTKFQINTKKHLEILLFYTCVPQMMIMSCMVPEISSTIDRIFCHFGQFFALPTPPITTRKIKILKKWKKNSRRYYHFKHMYHQSKSYDVWFLRYRARQTEFFLILGHFLPFYTPSPPPNNPETQNFEKMKKAPGNIIILHKCTKNHDHRLYCSWDMACDGFNYFSFWAILFPFTPLTSHKMRISKKWKTILEISSF